MPTVSFTTDAVIANRRFTADAVLIGTRLLHDRTLDHTGVETAETVVLSAPIGPYPSGTTVQAVLTDLGARLAALEQANRFFGYFRMDAFILPTFRVNAIIKKTQSSSFTANAVISLSGVRTFTINAVVRASVAPGTSFTANAFIV